MTRSRPDHVRRHLTMRFSLKTSGTQCLVLSGPFESRNFKIGFPVQKTTRSFMGLDTWDGFSRKNQVKKWEMIVTDRRDEPPNSRYGHNVVPEEIGSHRVQLSWFRFLWSVMKRLQSLNVHGNVAIHSWRMCRRELCPLTETESCLLVVNPPLASGATMGRSSNFKTPSLTWFRTKIICQWATTFVSLVMLRQKCKRRHHMYPACWLEKRITWGATQSHWRLKQVRH